MRLDLSVKIFLILGLNLTRDLERNTRFLCNFDGKVSAFDGRYPPQERQVVVFGIDDLTRGRVDPVVDGTHACELFLLALKIADGHKVDIGKMSVKLT